MSVTQKKRPLILVADDDPAVQRIMRIYLTQEDYDVIVVSTGENVLRELASEEVDLLLLDMQLPGIDGIETLKRAKEKYPDVGAVMVSGQGTIETAVKAMKLEAYDFITKPFTASRLKITVLNALKLQAMKKEITDLKSELKSKFHFDNIIGESGTMQQIFRAIGKVSKSNITVLLTGESGTGKELIARAIHNDSARKDKPFVALNCAAIPENLLETEIFGHEKGAFTGATRQRIGKVEQADGGTVLLDEVGEMTHGVQAKLLRFIQEREFERVGGNELVKVDVRIVAATNKDLAEMVKQNLFREDLYYRLSAFPLRLPPLRERKEDIPLLVQHCLKKYSEEPEQSQIEVQKEAMDLLLKYEWPGNVRELENVINRATVIATEKLITMDDLPAVMQTISQTELTQRKSIAGQLIQLGRTLPELVEFVKSEVIQQVLNDTDNNIRLTAKKLGISRGMIYRHVDQIENDNSK